MRINIRIGLFVIVLFLSYSLSYGADYSKTIKAQAKESVNSIKNKDMKSFIKRVYPGLIKLFGSEDKLIEMTKKQIETMEKSGIFLHSVEFGKIGTIYKEGEELQCLLEQKITMKQNKELITESSYLLCISKDSGANWYFVDLGKLDKKLLKNIVPNLSSKIILPKEPAAKKVTEKK